MKRSLPILFLGLGAFAQTARRQSDPQATNSTKSTWTSATTDFVRGLRGANARMPSGRTFGIVAGGFPASDAAGKTVCFSAGIKTEKVQDGYAGLWWNAQGPREPDHREILDFDNSQVRFVNGQPDTHNGVIRGATGTTPWKLYELELSVEKTTSYIYFGAILTDTGTAWVEAMKVELDAPCVRGLE